MNIHCPNCRTSYVVPDARVGDKPKKMRCARCQEVFTVKRRSEKTPLGYQEFTGKQNALPQEFAFLRVSNPPPAAAPSDPAPPPTGEVAEEAASEEKATAASPTEVKPSLYEEYASGFNDEKTHPGFAPASILSSGAQPPPTAPNLPPQQPPAPAPAGSQTAAPATGPQAAAPSQDLFSASSWETEAPLDLGSYAASSEGSQRIGKFVAAGVGVVLLFFFFVFARNGFNVSLGELPEQIAFAFSGGEYEELPDAVRDLEVTVNERRLLNRSGGGTLLVVLGTVFNNSPVMRRSIVLRGRMVDPAGDVRGEMRIPCDKMFEDTVLKKTAVGQIPALYRKNGAPADCSIRGESSGLFQMVFEGVPADYDSSYTLDIQPVNAE